MTSKQVYEMIQNAVDSGEKQKDIALRTGINRSIISKILKDQDVSDIQMEGLARRGKIRVGESVFEYTKLVSRILEEYEDMRKLEKSRIKKMTGIQNSDINQMKIKRRLKWSRLYSLCLYLWEEPVIEIEPPVVKTRRGPINGFSGWGDPYSYTS